MNSPALAGQYQSNALTDAQREARARRLARGLGLQVRKSRRDGSYLLVDPWRNSVVAYGYGSVGLSLDVLEEELAERFEGITRVTA